MKILCDVHISKKIVHFFHSKGIEALHVNDILDGDRTKDVAISNYADHNDFIVLTKDADFANTYHLKKIPKRLIKVGLGNLSTKSLKEVLEKNLSEIEQQFQNLPCMIEIRSRELMVIFH
ncbi:MAG: DUF5615 family PIN-like protein [Bacteroidota bacterium]